MSIFATTIALSLALFFTPCTIEEGRASQYAEGIFQRVVGLRQDWGQLPEDVSMYDGFIAARECSDIGKAYYVRPVGAKEWDHVLAADCASPNDRQSEVDLRSGKEWMETEGILCEVSANLAVKWKTVGRMIDIEMLTCHR
jgi:hypothetical protein